MRLGWGGWVGAEGRVGVGVGVSVGVKVGTVGRSLNPLVALTTAPTRRNLFECQLLNTDPNPTLT